MYSINILILKEISQIFKMVTHQKSGLDIFVLFIVERMWLGTIFLKLELKTKHF